MDKSTVAESVFDTVEEKILSGEYSDGDIISELKLCSLLGVSRTPVREALKRLRQEGLVADSAKGSVVIGITKKDISDIYDIRIRVEGLATKMCAEVISEEQLKELKDTLELQEFYTERGSAEGIKDIDSRFHQLIYSYAKSRVLEPILTDLHRKAQRYRRASVENKDRARLAVKEHIAIYEALAAHDKDLAEKLCVAHIENAKASILASFKNKESK